MKTLMYPMAIMGLSVMVLVVLLTVAMPPLLAVFERMDTEIPLMTRIALDSVRAIRENFLTAAIVISTSSQPSFWENDSLGWPTF